LLDANEGVRRAFKAFLTPQDVFAHLAEFTENLPLEELRPALLSHARMQLTTNEGLIYFDEAGDDSGGIALQELAIDIPVASSPGSPTALSSVLERAEAVLRTKTTGRTGAKHLVLTGAPGNGKTTVSKFLVQILRAHSLKAPLSSALINTTYSWQFEPLSVASGSGSQHIDVGR
jgi:Cdc6-like AAA superfamily ATPase